MDFKYRVSVIVPIYNTEMYLASCLDSLVEQTVDKSKLEVLLIDDGSTDSSAEICKEYCEKYDFFKYFHNENSGVSKTRNFGIKHSQGKYILFLDSDDRLTPESIEYICNFFDKVYKKVDMVTYFIQPYKGTVMLPTHSRYRRLLTHSGIYDLEENPYIVQTTMNICVKNRGEKSKLFNEEMAFQEDQEYINRILAKRLKIGYCAEACYLYNRENEGSAVASKFHAYYLFESSMEYFESLFAKYKNRPVPRYFQAIFFHDLRWKLTSKILFPFHYEGEQYENAINRIKALLARVDNDIIVKNKSIVKNHIHFWLDMKPNTFPQPYVNNKIVSIVADGKTVYKNDNINLKLIKIEQTDIGTIRVRGCIDSPIYQYTKEIPEVYAIVNDTKKIRLDFFRSCYSFVSTDIMTNKLYGFTLDLNPEDLNKLSFEAYFDSFRFDVHFLFLGTSIFKHNPKRLQYCLNDYLVTYYNDSVLFEKKTKDEIYEFEKDMVENQLLDKYSKDLKLDAIDYRYSHRVWLYSDLETVEKDNGYYQFKNDFKKNDGVERYYVYTKEYSEIEDLFTEEEKKNLVEFGSYQHQLLYLASEVVISSFFGRTDVSPFIIEDDEYDKYIEIEHFKIVYMQHGILHASFPRKYSAERAACDKVVVSSNFEIKNLTENYAYKDDQLIKCGMPRFNRIDRSAQPKNRILLAPSWRSYFASNITSSNYAINTTAFEKSDYYQGFMAYLSDERLQKALKDNDIILDVKMHPIVKDIVSELFDVGCENINIVTDDVKIEDYKLFITDFSSFVFDYAYLSRPVLYFVPDYPQFKSGMNLYRDLDLPFEEAFGAFTKDADSAVKETEKVIANNFVAEPVYKERMDSFYLDMGNCEEDIYNYIVNTMF